MAKRVFEVPHHVARVVMATVSLAAWLGVVAGAAPAAEPSPAAAPTRGEDCDCFRPLSDVIWGFLVTLLACTVSVWGFGNYTLSERKDKLSFLFAATFVPVFGLLEFISQSLQSAVLIWRYHKLCRNSSQPPPFRGRYGHLKMLWSWVSPFSKSTARIFFRCDVVVYVTKESRLLQEKWLWEYTNEVVDVSEAMVIGEVLDGKTQDGHYKCKELSFAGKTALLLVGAVPKYDELKFLRGNSGFAVIALAIQALGYVYAVFFRVVKDLPVAPLEVVGLLLNIVLLMEIIVYGFFNPCHRPLVIYMNSRQKEELLQSMAQSMVQVNIGGNPHEWLRKESNIVLSVVSTCMCGMVIYFMVLLSKGSSFLVVVPLIIFLVATFILTILMIIEIDTPQKYTTFGFGVSLCIVAYIWAFVVTIIYWESQHFSAEAKLLNVSQLIPFIG